MSCSCSYKGRQLKQRCVSPRTRSANAMKVRLGVLGEVKVDDDVDRLNVNTSGEQICWMKPRKCDATQTAM